MRTNIIQSTLIAAGMALILAAPSVSMAKAASYTKIPSPVQADRPNSGMKLSVYSRSPGISSASGIPLPVWWYIWNSSIRCNFCAHGAPAYPGGNSERPSTIGVFYPK